MTRSGAEPASWQPGKKSRPQPSPVAPGALRARAQRPESAWAMSSRANSKAEGGILPWATMDRRASRMASAMGKPSGQTVVHRSQAMHESTRILAVWRPLTMASLLYIWRA